LKRKRILVADDEVYIVHILEFSLNMEGYEVVSATSGEDALRMIDKERPDLIVLDIMMPGVSGYEVCRRLRADERTRDIPIIFLTAKDTLADRDFGLELGANAYITKPFGPRKLIEAIENLLEVEADEDGRAVGM
jgi:two-component system alkaline phosphatase synthesis response regulator PhoP